ncbi:MAG TPA: hypothetical protein VHJ59_08570, partial [Nitrososphaera sp.]|nr:hypothetical protein [Nitrososphaera sp.]
MPHVYAASAISTNPNKVTGKLLTSQGAERAKTPTPDIEVTVQKHVTSLSLALRPADSDFGVDSAFTMLGKLLDTDANGAQIGGKTITFSGSGVTPQSINPVQTGGMTASGPSGINVTLADGELILPVGSHISLPASSFGVTYKFTGASTGSDVGLTLTKPDNSVRSPKAIVGSQQQYPFAVKDIAIRNVSGSTSSSEFAKLQILNIINSAVEPPEQLEIDFRDSQGVGQVDGSYSSVPISRGSYFSTGVSPPDLSSGLKVTAAYDGTGDTAYLGATSSEVSYNADPAQGKGTGTTTANSALAGDFVWTQLSVGSGDPATDVCTQNGVASTTGDADKDGICDKWESSTGGNGNDGDNRYVVCPTKVGGTALDTDCIPTTASGGNLIKYDLCITDEFANVWSSGPAYTGTGSTVTPPSKICPTVGHKDLYVEIDSMTG